MYAKVWGATINGLDGHMVAVEVDITQGLPNFEIVGLPAASIREARERVRSAISNSGFEFPMRRIVVNLAPADLRKEGSALDLAIAVGILCATGQVKLRKNKREQVLAQTLFSGELSLDGSIQAVRGTIAMAIEALDKDIKVMATGRANAKEACAVDSMTCYVADSLKGLIQKLESHEAPEGILMDQLDFSEIDDDYADVKGQEVGKRAMEIAAAGFHHVLMMGPPGAGKTMLACRLPGILPPLRQEERLEISKIHNIAGLLEDGHLMESLPYRAPHHTSSLIGLAGGGNPIRPGEITLAHGGVLFRDEVPEFSKASI